MHFLRFLFCWFAGVIPSFKATFHSWHCINLSVIPVEQGEEAVLTTRSDQRQWLRLLESACLLWCYMHQHVYDFNPLFEMLTTFTWSLHKMFFFHYVFIPFWFDHYFSILYVLPFMLNGISRVTRMPPSSPTCFTVSYSHHSLQYLCVSSTVQFFSTHLIPIRCFRSSKPERIVKWCMIYQSFLHLKKMKLRVRMIATGLIWSTDTKKAICLFDFWMVNQGCLSTE